MKIYNINLIAYQITNTYSPALSPVTATIEWRAVTGLSIERNRTFLELPLQRRVGTNDWQTATDARDSPQIQFAAEGSRRPASLTVSKHGKMPVRL